MRIQILHLPAPADEYPFAVVIDDADDEALNWPEDFTARAREQLGARSVMVFRGMVDVT